ncbi:MAG: hypothetical protein FJW63_08095, partial [Actinobacteria bacterium]|nr:hypothetical protein [Actinomycetota bacterium]
MTLKDIGNAIGQLLIKSTPPGQLYQNFRTAMPQIPSYPEQIRQNFQRLNPVTQAKNLLTAPVPEAIRAFPYYFTRPQEYRAGQLAVKPTDARTVGQYAMGGPGKYGIPTREQVAGGIESAMMSYPPVASPVQFARNISALQRLKQGVPTAAVMAGLTGGLRALRGEKLTPEEVLTSAGIGLFMGGIQAVPRGNIKTKLKPPQVGKGIKPEGSYSEIQWNKLTPQQQNEAHLLRLRNEMEQRAKVAQPQVRKGISEEGVKILANPSTLQDVEYYNQVLSKGETAKIELPYRGKIGEIEKQIDQLIGYSPSGAHWKQDYYIRQVLLEEAKQNAPPGIIQQIEKLENSLEIMKENKELYENVIRETKNLPTAVNKEINNLTRSVDQISQTLRSQASILRKQESQPRLSRSTSPIKISQNQTQLPNIIQQTVKQPPKPQSVRGYIKSPELNFTKWQDKPALSLTRETFERNITDVAREDAPKIKQFIVDPVRKNETARAEFINKTRNEIRKTINKLNIKAGSKEDALIQRYGEGNIKLDQLKKETNNWENIVEGAKYFRGKYDELLDQINQVRTKYGYNPIPKRQDYFRHFQELGNVIEQFGLIFKEEDLPTEISGITEMFRPGKPFTTAELQRRGGKYTESAIRGMDNYLDSVSRQIFHTDSVQRVRALENYIRESGDAGFAKLPNFVANVREYGNLLAGKKATFDRAFESVFGRPFYGAINWVKNRTSANLVGGNVSSAMTNFIPFTQSLATTDKPSFIRGLFESVISPIKTDYSEIGGVKSGFLTRRFPQKYIQPTFIQNVGSKANWLFETIDRFTAKAVVAGKYFENTSKGLNPKEAMLNADDYAAKVLADRSIGQLPNLMGSRTLGVVTQFQTEINNLYSFLKKDIPQMSNGNAFKIANALGQFVVYSYVFNNLYEKITGRRPTLDVIN